EVTIDAAVVGFLPLDVTARVEFKEQSAPRVFYRERTRRHVAPVAADKIAAVGSLNAGERVLVTVGRAAAVGIVKPLLPPQLAARVEGRNQYAGGMGKVIADNIILPNRHIAAIGGLSHRVEVGPGRPGWIQFPLPLHRTGAVELEDKCPQVPIVAGHAPSGDIAAITRLSDLGDGAAVRSDRVTECP